MSFYSIAFIANLSYAEACLGGCGKTRNAGMNIYGTQNNISGIRNTKQIIRNGKTRNGKSRMVKHGTPHKEQNKRESTRHCLTSDSWKRTRGIREFKNVFEEQHWVSICIPVDSSYSLWQLLN